jgi:pimeloyl-ACP methyl ester carboxylesterase
VSLGAVIPGTRVEGLGVVRRVHANGIDVGYRQFGTGPPLVLVMGQSATMNEWGRRLPLTLARAYRVTMFDNRGAGHSSDEPSKPLTIELMADDTAALMDRLEIAEATIVGWSTGGEIGLSLAERHADKVASLVVAGATAGGPTAVQPSPAVQRLFASNSPKLLGLLFPDPTLARTYLGEAFSLPKETVSARTLARQEQAEIRFARTTDTYDALPKITAPTIVENGALDQLVPAQNARIIARRIPHARLVIVPNAAHAVIFQNVPAFARLVASSGLASSFSSGVTAIRTTRDAAALHKALVRTLAEVRSRAPSPARTLALRGFRSMLRSVESRLAFANNDSGNVAAATRDARRARLAFAAGAAALRASGRLLGIRVGRLTGY